MKPNEFNKILEEIYRKAEFTNNSEGRKLISKCKKQHKKELEETEIKHLIKMKEEKNQLELDKEKVKMEADYQKKEMDMMKKHHEKILESLGESKKDIKEVYVKIMERLPNVNMSINQGHKEKES